MAKNAAAVALGRMARGVPKTLTDEQREALAQRMREVVRIREENRARARAEAEAVAQVNGGEKPAE